jgi:hypothetical protein
MTYPDHPAVPDLSDDDALEAILSSSIDHLDPVPEAAVRAAAVACEMPHADGELATLVAESSLGDVLLLRDEAENTTLTFAAPHMTVELEIDRDHHAVGAITPPLATEIEVERSARQPSTPPATARSDDLGRFRLELGAGLCRLRIGSGPDAVLTSWFYC